MRVSTTKDRRRYYAFVDAAIPAEPDSNRSREILLLDCVDAEAFDRTGDALDQDENMPGNCLVLLAIKKRVEHFRSEDVSLPPLGGGETALVNLLPIVLPKEIFVASSPFDGARAIGELHHQENPPRFDWAIKNGTFWSFHDPREAVTRAIVDLDQVEAIETGCRRERSD